MNTLVRRKLTFHIVKVRQQLLALIVIDDLQSRDPVFGIGSGAFDQATELLGHPPDVIPPVEIRVVVNGEGKRVLFPDGAELQRVIVGMYQELIESEIDIAGEITCGTFIKLETEGRESSVSGNSRPTKRLL